MHTHTRTHILLPSLKNLTVNMRKACSFLYQTLTSSKHLVTQGHRSFPISSHCFGMCPEWCFIDVNEQIFSCSSAQAPYHTPCSSLSLPSMDIPTLSYFSQLSKPLWPRCQSRTEFYLPHCWAAPHSLNTKHCPYAEHLTKVPHEVVSETW